MAARIFIREGEFLLESSEYPVRPDQISATWPLIKTFGNYQIALTVNAIIRLCQARGEWVPITKAELAEQCGDLPLHFEWLLYKGYLVEKEEKFIVTDVLIDKCYIATLAA